MVATTLAYVYCVHTYSMLYISNHNNICIIFTAEFTENIWRNISGLVMYIVFGYMKKGCRCLFMTAKL